MANVIDFSQWLENEMKVRGWRQADLIKRSGVSSGLISQILSGQRSPGVDTCRAIARAFGMKEIQVLKIAGLVADSETAKFTPVVEAAATMLNELSEDDQEEIRAIIRVKYERRQKRQASKRHE